MPPGAILSFVNELGVTKATTVIDIKRFETSVRRYLEATVPRLMLVLDPIQVIIDDLPHDHLEMLEMPFSKDPTYGVSSVVAGLLAGLCLTDAPSLLDTQRPVYESHLHRAQ